MIEGRSVGIKLGESDLITEGEVEELLEVIKLGSSDLIFEGRSVGIKLGTSDLITEGGVEGLLEVIKLGSSDLISVGRFEGIKLGLSEPSTEGTTEAAVGKLVGGSGNPPTGALVTSGPGPSMQSLHATAL